MNFTKQVAMYSLIYPEKYHSYLLLKWKKNPPYFNTLVNGFSLTFHHLNSNPAPIKIKLVFPVTRVVIMYSYLLK